jgi:hypothetical protein
MYSVLIILYDYFLVLERIVWVSIISYWEIRFAIRVLWITRTFPERIMLANQGTIVCGNNFPANITWYLTLRKRNVDL